MLAKDKLILLQRFAEQELHNNVLPFWRTNSVDIDNGGFVGEILFNNSSNIEASKGLVLNARILWSFSAAYNYSKNNKDLELANRAFNYLCTYFFDKKHAGYFWEVSFDGKPSDTKKQIYALAFAMYGFSEYYKVSKNEDALNRAKDLFYLIEKHAFDKELNGYYEAFSQDWKELDDIRLSTKDMNEKKTMNTHLHVVEAYANLYTVWKSDELKTQIENLVRIFLDKIISSEDFHLKLFFDENWISKSTLISYGHDIEAGWLVYESALISGSENIIEEAKNMVPLITNAALEGFSDLGGIFHEGDRAGKEYDHELEWWPQAEALVGLLDSYKITKDEKYLDYAIKISEVITNFFVDKKNGEWFYRIDKNGKPIESYPKAGFWKCPYHNVRACIELLKRINELT